MECILHLNNKLLIKKMPARTAKKKDIIKKRKQNVKNNLRKTLGILVDTPQHGYGSSNTENIARTFFHSYEIGKNLTKLIYIV